MKRYWIVVLLCISVLFAGCGEKGSKEDKVSIKTLENGQYQLLVNKDPFIIKGVCYAPVPIGKSCLFNFTSDPARPWIIDGKLMKEMGVNTIRLYQPGDEVAACKEMITDLYTLYGIRTVMGHSLGFWDYPPPNYGDQEFLDEVTESVISMVNYFKDVQGILLWNLGNENNYSFDGRINPWTTPEIEAMQSYKEKTDERARLYYSFVNELAKKIKEVDHNRLVSLGNGETVGLKIAAKNCPDVDLLGCIVYRGKVFGSFFKEVKRKFDKPVFLTEFGCDAFNAVKQKEDQRNQAKFLKSQWIDIMRNVAGSDGFGNCVGGIVFEWSDEWWKMSESNRDSWWVHDTSASWGMGAYAFDAKAGKNMNEEWFGLVGLSDEEIENGINKRIPRKVFYVMRELWVEKTEKSQ